MMSRNAKLCLLLIGLSGMFILLAIVFCALEEVETSAAIGVVACIISLAAFYFAFASYEDVDDEEFVQSKRVIVPPQETVQKNDGDKVHY